jgi:large repetitive protein
MLISPHPFCRVAGSILACVFSLAIHAAPPSLEIISPAAEMLTATLPPITGWATDDVSVQSVSVVIREKGPDLPLRYWNGTNWQTPSVFLPTTLSGTNWTLAASVAIPPLNSGIAYDVEAIARDNENNGWGVQHRIYAPIEDLTWDPGTTHLGTQIKSQPHTLGGPFAYKIVTQGTTVGGWRTALNVTSGESDVYLRSGSVPSPSSYHYASANAGSDGFVLNQYEFTESQEWYYLVNAQAGSTWNLVSGEPYVLNLGALPDAAASGNTNVTMGAEGYRFFRTVAPVNTLAWRLWLNGSANSILVRKDFIPTITSSLFDLNQSGAMLVVPDYLQDNQTYFVGVPGNPGQALNFQSKQQPIADVAFNSGQSGIAINDYPYRTYRVAVPIDQIAWQVKTIPSAGNADVAIRRTKVPNENNNDAYSEVPGTVQDSVTLVPPTLSDGTFYITVYGATNRTYALTNGEPFIPIRAFALTNVNDQPALVGWRYYVVSDIPSQLGTLGWELMLSGQPPGTEIALRRNAVPGRWNFRNGFGGSQGYVDYSDTDGLMQRPGHQADIWYIGIYQVDTNLGAFTLNTHAIVPPLVAFNSFTTNVATLPRHKWQYLRIDVPAEALGWDLRIGTYNNGYPQFAVRRDLLPEGLGGSLYGAHDWPSGAQQGSGGDWTTYPSNPDGSSVSHFSAGRSNPIVAGTYYIGVRDDSGPGPVSYTLVSRGIGTNYAIAVSNLNFTGTGSAVSNNVGLPVREAAYYRFVVPPNQPNWKLRLTPTSGDAMMIVQRDFLPNAYGGTSGSRRDVHGVRLQKLGREHYLALPADGEGLLPPETNYVVVISEGVGPNPSTRTVGTGVTTYTLESLGPIPVSNLGMLSAAPGNSLSQSVSLEGGEVKLFQFTVSAGTGALEIRLNNRVGNPSFTVRFGTNACYPHVYPPPFGEYYGADGGYFQDRKEDYNLFTIPNPAPGVYSLTMKAEDDSNVYPEASGDLVVTARDATPLAFNNGSTSVTAQPPREWRYFRIDVPANALGWDVRLKNLSGGYPTMIVRRDLLPDLGVGDFCVYCGGDWPSGGQLRAPFSDWTERARDTDLSDYSRKAMVMGRSNILSSGTYFVGVYNDPPFGTDASYTIESRGIGSGFAIGVTNLNFSGTGSAFTNSTGLAPREADYFRLVIPPNARSWKLRATATDGGELLLAVHHDDVPNTFTHPTARSDSIGRKMHKDGKEHFLLLPDEGQDFLMPRTNYIAVISEGHDPLDYQTLGTNSVAYILESLGEAPVADLGLVPNVGSGIISEHVTLEGGETRLFRFALSNAADSLEIRLENRVGNPSFMINAGTNPPYSGIPFGPGLFDDAYGIDGGWISSRVGDYQLITVANPTQGIYSVSIKAEDTGSFIYSDAEADFTVTPIGSGNVAFDGGSASVSEHSPGTWRYFTIEVPADALGWDLRLIDVTEPNIRLHIRRDELPAIGAPAQSPYANNWPSGNQISVEYDWTQLSEPDGSTVYGHTVTFGRGNPLTNGAYRIGVFNSAPFNSSSYTLTSRGLGAGYSIPVNTIDFNGGIASHPGLAPREASYYAVDVPANAPSWKLKLDTSAGGESRMVVHKDYLPSVFNVRGERADYVGKVLAKSGDEHYVLLPDDGQTNIAAGTYYIVVASEGVNPGSGRIGIGTSAFTLQSLGPVAVTHLGTVPAPGSGISRPVALEGGEIAAFQYAVPPGVQWLEFRVANRQGNPGFALRPGVELPYPQVPTTYFNPYGADGGYFNQRIEGFHFQTYVRPAAGIWALTVKAEYVGSEYPGATNTIEVEQRIPSALVFSNGMVSTSLGDNQRIFYQVTVPTNVLGWKLDLVASNGVPLLRVRKDLLPSDAEPAMPFGGPSVVIAPPFLETGTWFVEVKGSGPTTFKLTSNPVLIQRPAWNMQAFGAPVTTPGLPSNEPSFADTGIGTNGVALPGDQGTDLGAGDFHYYAINVPNGNGGLLRAELLAISGNPDMFVRRGGLPTFNHREFGSSGNELIDFQLTGTGTEYANWVPLDGRTEIQLGTGLWYVAVRASASNARYRMRLGVGAVTNFASGTTLSGQLIAAGDWRYYRIVLPTNAPQSMTVTYNQQQGDTVMYVRDTIPPGEPYDGSSDNYRRWIRDNKNGGPYFDYPDGGTYTLTTPTLRPGNIYYLGFRAVNDASFTVGLNFSAQTIDVTNVIAFSGGTSTVTIPAFGVARFRVPVPADATSWRHSNTHSAEVKLYLDQGTLPDLSRPYSIWQSYNADSQLIQFLYGWPWVANQNYYFFATNTSATPQPLTIRLDGRNAATDDSDGDGLPDGWEILYFGNLSQNGFDDSDGDGINNATEFAEGTNPNNAASLRPRLMVQAIGNGHVVVEPSLTNYTAGQAVTLTAVADAENIFAGWSGDTTNATSNPLMITMNSNKTIVATFNGTSTPLLLEFVHVLGNGDLQFTVTGPAAASMIIDAVSALGDPWVPIHTNSPFSGAFTFEDVETGSSVNRFYRARLPQ